MKKRILMAVLAFLFLGSFFWKAIPEEQKIVSPVVGVETRPTIIQLVSSTVSSTASEVQVIKGVYEEEGFTPYRFEVKSGIPVRLEVFSKIDGFGCMGSIMIPDLSEEIQGFEAGKTNVFVVTPPRPGEYLITCAMGTPHAVIDAK